MKKIAIIYDWIDKWGGVERILLTLFREYPNAQFFTSYYDEEKAPWAKNLKIKQSFMQNFPKFIKTNRILSSPFYPYAFESFDFKGYDIVISITSSFAKAVITRPETLHVCYLLTPTRYLWHETKTRRSLGFLNIFAGPYINYLKRWDRIASKRPDRYFVISNEIKKRLNKYYDLDGDVVYPPFDTDYWSRYSNKKLKRESFYLVVSRLEPYKNIEPIIRTFNRLYKNTLLIVGTGSQEEKLKSLAGSNIFFKKFITDEELSKYYQTARATIMMQEEDFGYTSLESQFFNCPVIAYKKGGAIETVLDNKTGILVEDNSLKSIKSAIEKFDTIAYTFQDNMKKYTSAHLSKFSLSLFINRFQTITK